MNQLSNNLDIELNKLDTLSKGIVNSKKIQKLYDYNELDINEKSIQAKPAQAIFTNKIEPVEKYMSLAELLIDDGKDNLQIIGTGKDYLDKRDNGAVQSQNDDILSKYVTICNDRGGNFIWGFDAPVGKEKNIIFARHVKNNTFNADIGTIIFSLNMDYLLNIYKDLNMGENANTYVVNSDGMVISSKNKNEIGSQFKEKLMIQEIKKDTLKNKSQTFTLNIDGSPYLTLPNKRYFERSLRRNHRNL
jgi:hypothetical protein